MDDETPYEFPDKPAYGVPETVDYTKLTEIELLEHSGDGPGFDPEDKLPPLPPSDYFDGEDYYAKDGEL